MADWDCRILAKSTIASDQQSSIQSTVGNPNRHAAISIVNRQSENRQSATGNLQ
jgi:hypothetical protein